MKKKVLGFLGLGVTFVAGMVVGYVMAEDEYNGYMNSMFEDEEEEDTEYEDQEIAQDFDREEADTRDGKSADKE